MNTTKREKLVLITGVSRGIGRAMFLQMASTPGLKVVGLARSKHALHTLEQECVNAGYSGFYCFEHDVTRQYLPEQLMTLFEETGRLDVLINNAGALVNKPFVDISLEEWESCYFTNVYGPFRLIQLVHPWLLAAGEAHVVNIGSMGGVQGSAKFAGLSAYSSSKMALVGLTECLAEEFRGSGIHVNGVNLGAVQTEMLAEAFPGYEAPHHPPEIATWLIDFALNGGRLMNGKSVSLSSTTP
ncbi:MAG: SDR family oxidoreductase [Cryomorphaceae bacterium]|nr:MAG: SDR family oxidoreductase [Cryomorphaceae bacterium]